MVNTAGRQDLPNEIQNTPTIGSQVDASHIICGAHPDHPGWTANQIHIKGEIILEFSGGGGLGGGLGGGGSGETTNQIVADDTTSSVTCEDNNIVNIQGQVNINQQPSNQYVVVYGEPDNTPAQLQYSIPFTSPKVGDPNFDLKMWGFSDFQSWFAHQQYNQPDNAFITRDSNSFRLLQDSNYMVEIMIKWQLLFTEDGKNPKTYICCGLYNVDTNQIVPQSLHWYAQNDIKNKYFTLATTFTMRSDNGVSRYLPFYQQQDGGAYNQFQTTTIGGLCRSSIQFKFYQFVSY